MADHGSQKIRIRLKAYDHQAARSERPARSSRPPSRTGARVAGPIPLPTTINKFTVLRGPHVDKKSREQFEIRTHKRLLDILEPTPADARRAHEARPVRGRRRGDQAVTAPTVDVVTLSNAKADTLALDPSIFGGGGEGAPLLRGSAGAAGEAASGYAQHKEPSRRLRGAARSLAAEGHRARTAGFDARPSGRAGAWSSGRCRVPTSTSAQEGAACGPALGALAARFGGSGEGGELLRARRRSRPSGWSRSSRRSASGTRACSSFSRSPTRRSNARREIYPGIGDSAARRPERLRRPPPRHHLLFTRGRRSSNCRNDSERAVAQGGRREPCTTSSEAARHGEEHARTRDAEPCDFRGRPAGEQARDPPRRGDALLGQGGRRPHHATARQVAAGGQDDGSQDQNWKKAIVTARRGPDDRLLRRSVGGTVMAIKIYKPTSPGATPDERRGSVGTRTQAARGLSVAHRARSPQRGGRNTHGRITTRFRGGGHKRRYRVIDFSRDKLGIPAMVAAIEYDPNRTARIALLHYADGEKRYILAPTGLQVGDTVSAGPDGRHQARATRCRFATSRSARSCTTSSSRRAGAASSCARPVRRRSSWPRTATRRRCACPRARCAWCT